MFSIENGDVVEDDIDEDRCRTGTRLMLAGLIIVTLSGLIFVMALNSTPNESEGYAYGIIIAPQIVGMIIGTVMAGAGYYLRHRYCV